MLNSVPSLLSCLQLHDRVGFDLRLVRVGKPKWFHRSMPQRLRTALGHYLDRQAAIEIGCARLPFVKTCFVAGEQRCRQMRDIAHATGSS